MSANLFNDIPQAAEDMTLKLLKGMKSLGITAMNGIYDSIPQPEQQMRPIPIRINNNKRMNP